MSNWLNPLNKLAFVQAILVHKSQVVLPDGRSFNLSYVGYNGHSAVHIQAVRNEHKAVTPLPFGYFNLDTVLNPYGLWFDLDNPKTAKEVITSVATRKDI